jgi:hypothetical protein
MPGKWTAELDQQLFALIIQDFVGKIDYNKLAAKMDGFTAMAIRHRVDKLKGKDRSRTGGSVKDSAIHKASTDRQGAKSKGVKRERDFKSEEELEEKKVVKDED